MITTLTALRTYRPVARAKRALTRSWLSWARHRVAADLTAAKEHLATLEEDLTRQLPPEIHADLSHERENLRARVAELEEELAFVDQRYASTSEDCDCCSDRPSP